MIAAVAMTACWSITGSLGATGYPAAFAKRPHHAAAPHSPRQPFGAKRQPSLAATVKALIRKNASNRELVRFADRRQRPVQVIRGGSALPGQGGPGQSKETIASSNERMAPVQVLRGGPPVVAAISTARPPTAASVPPGPSVQIVRFANRGEQPVTVLRGSGMTAVALNLPALAGSPSFDLFAAAGRADLDRIAFAVDGAESSHGADPRMWRPELAGPQGPMQVSAAAAIDSGGGDRFDLIQNRQLGRAYLARLYQRYGNWPDAVAAYNWGPGNMDIWIAQGRREAGLPLEVERYRLRVLRDGGISQAAGSPAARAGWPLSPP